MWGIVSLGENRKKPSEMAPMRFELILNILKGYCFTVKLWNQNLKREVCVESRMATSKPEPNFPPT